MKVHPRSLMRRVGASSLVAGLLAALVLVPAPANAAAGSAFSPDDQVIFTSKSDPGNTNGDTETTLHKLTENAGSYTFTDVGPSSGINYNALAYNSDDRYLYAIVTGPGDPVTPGIEQGDLIKIGSGGGWEQVGDENFGLKTMGAYDPSSKEYWVLSATSPTDIIRIDLDPDSPDYGTEIATVDLEGAGDHDAAGGGSDWAFSGGFLWSLGTGGIYRIASDGSVDSWATPSGAGSNEANDTSGAAWTLLGDILGFSYNKSGQVLEIKVDNPDADNPTFTTLSKKNGVGSAGNDGAAIPGSVDLELNKKAKLSSNKKSITYTLTVKNNGSANSSGWTVTDELPDGLSNAEVSGDGNSSVKGDTVTVTGGYLANGDSRVITIKADVDVTSGKLKNTASVEGNDPDNVKSNNKDNAVVSLGDPAVSPGDVDAPDTGVQPVSMWQTYTALGMGAAMLLALGAWRVAARRE